MTGLLRHPLFALALIPALCLPASAESRVASLLMAMSNGSLAGYRGGASRPLGMYTIKGHSVAFDTEYRNETPALQAEFADFLGRYNESRGAGWEVPAHRPRQGTAVEKSLTRVA